MLDIPFNKQRYGSSFNMASKDDSRIEWSNSPMVSLTLLFLSCWCIALMVVNGA
jgi:hypothetical protein